MATTDDITSPDSTPLDSATNPKVLKSLDYIVKQLVVLQDDVDQLKVLVIGSTKYSVEGLQERMKAQEELSEKMLSIQEASESFKQGAKVIFSLISGTGIGGIGLAVFNAWF